MKRYTLNAFLALTLLAIPAHSMDHSTGTLQNPLAAEGPLTSMPFDTLKLIFSWLSFYELKATNLTSKTFKALIEVHRAQIINVKHVKKPNEELACQSFQFFAR